jgi:hypothetical protein
MNTNVGARKWLRGIVCMLALAGFAPGTAAADVLPAPAALPIVEAVELPASEPVAPVETVTNAAAAAVAPVADPVADVEETVVEPVVVPVVESVARAVEATPVVRQVAATATEVAAPVGPPAATNLAPPEQPIDWAAPSATPPARPEAEPTPPPVTPARAANPGTVQSTPAQPTTRRAEPTTALAEPRPAPREIARTGAAAPADPVPLRPEVAATERPLAPPLPTVPPPLLELASAGAAPGFAGMGLLVVALALFSLIRLPRWLRVPLEPCLLRQSLFSTPLERPG